MKGSIFTHHQVEFQLPTPLFRHWNTNQSAALFRHEIDQFRRCIMSRRNEVAFIFTILIIYNNDEFSGPNVFERLFNRVERIIDFVLLVSRHFPVLRLKILKIPTSMQHSLQRNGRYTLNHAIADLVYLTKNPLSLTAPGIIE